MKTPAQHAAPAQKRRPLFEIVNEMLAQLAEADGEVTDQLDRLELELEDKCEAYAAVIRQLEAEASAMDDLAHGYAHRGAARQRTAAALRQRLAQGLAAARIERVHTATARLHVATSTRLELEDPQTFLVQCDPKFLRTEVTVVRGEVRRALEAGETIEGAQLVIQRHLRIT